jgi:hypothetical protein
MLPEYEVKTSKDFPEYLIVHCQYDGCTDRPFLVHAKTWKRPIRRVTSSGKQIVIYGRACPYCFRTGKLPSRRS